VTGRRKTASVTWLQDALAEGREAQIRSQMLIAWFLINRKQSESRAISLMLPDFTFSLSTLFCVFICALISLFVLFALV
jgi:hypothetical protein